MKLIIIILVTLLPFSVFSSDSDKELERSIDQLSSYKELNWWNAHLTYNSSRSRGVEILKTEEDVKMIVDPGMTDGQLESCNFNDFSLSTTEKLEALIDEIPSGLPENYSLYISSFKTICSDDAKYQLRIFNHLGVRKFSYSQSPKCAGKVPAWLNDIVEFLDKQYKENEQCLEI